MGGVVEGGTGDGGGAAVDLARTLNAALEQDDPSGYIGENAFGRIALDGTYDFVAVAKRVIAEGKPIQEWRPIETAPQDGTRILLWAAGDHVIGGWCVSAAPYSFEGWSTGWETSGGYDVGFSSIYPPTHWQPLPAPPSPPASLPPDGDAS